jgi:hypothetical protein
MRPVRTIAAVVFVAAIAITGCAANSTIPSPVPSPPVVDQAPLPVTDTPAPAPAPAPTPTPKRPVLQVPVLANGHYDAYLTRVDPAHRRLVVDLVQVFHDQAAVDAAVADGQPRDTAQVLSTYVRNQNSRLRTLPLASDVLPAAPWWLRIADQSPAGPAGRRRPGDERPGPHLLLHPDRGRRRGAAGAGEGGHQRLLSASWGGIAHGGAGPSPAPLV